MNLIYKIDDSFDLNHSEIGLVLDQLIDGVHDFALSLDLVCYGNGCFNVQNLSQVKQEVEISVFEMRLFVFVLFEVFLEIVFAWFVSFQDWEFGFLQYRKFVGI